MCLLKTITKLIERSYTGGGLSLVLGLDPVKCLLIWCSLKDDKSTTQLHCQGASQLVCSAVHNHSTCKLFLAPPFTLLIVPHNSAYYNYVFITQRLVVWFWGQGKKGVCVGKNVHCGLVACSMQKQRGKAWSIFSCV